MHAMTANAKSESPQGDFALRVKTELLRRGLSQTDLARTLELSRNTVSLAINRGLHEPTRRRIAEFLSIPLTA